MGLLPAWYFGIRHMGIGPARLSEKLAYGFTEREFGSARGPPN